MTICQSSKQTPDVLNKKKFKKKTYSFEVSLSSLLRKTLGINKKTYFPPLLYKSNDVRSSFKSDYYRPITNLPLSFASVPFSLKERIHVRLLNLRLGLKLGAPFKFSIYANTQKEKQRIKCLNTTN